MKLAPPNAEERAGWADWLQEGEALLWLGAPSRRLVVLRMHDLMLIPVSLLFLGIGGGAALFAIETEAGLLAMLIVLPLLTFALWFSVGRFFVDGWRRRRTRYALTDRRAIVAESFGGRSMRSAFYDLNPAPELGRGKVVFAYPVHEGRGDLRRETAPGLEFDLIGPDADAVFHTAMQHHRAQE